MEEEVEGGMLGKHSIHQDYHDGLILSLKEVCLCGNGITIGYSRGSLFNSLILSKSLSSDTIVRISALIQTAP